MRLIPKAPKISLAHAAICALIAFPLIARAQNAATDAPKLDTHGIVVANMDASVKPGSAKVECEPGKLQGTCSGGCSGSCEASGSAKCEGTCSGKCEGKCDGECDGPDLPFVATILTSPSRGDRRGPARRGD